jgi:hypothetical protein
MMVINGPINHNKKASEVKQNISGANPLPIEGKKLTGINGVYSLFILFY